MDVDSGHEAIVVQHVAQDGQRHEPSVPGRRLHPPERWQRYGARLPLRRLRRCGTATLERDDLVDDAIGRRCG
jgi:hypothetical protein